MSILAGGLNRIREKIGEHCSKLGGKHRGRLQFGWDLILDVDALPFRLVLYEPNRGVETLP